MDAQHSSHSFVSATILVVDVWRPAHARFGRTPRRSDAAWPPSPLDPRGAEPRYFAARGVQCVKEPQGLHQVELCSPHTTPPHTHTHLFCWFCLHHHLPGCERRRERERERGEGSQVGPGTQCLYLLYHLPFTNTIHFVCIFWLWTPDIYPLSVSDTQAHCEPTLPMLGATPLPIPIVRCHFMCGGFIICLHFCYSLLRLPTHTHTHTFPTTA